MKVSSEWRLYTLGTTLCVALIICSLNFADRGGPYFAVSLAVAGITYLLALRELLSTPGFSGQAVIFGLILCAVWHVAFLRLPPGSDDDIHRYVWDGRLQRLGYNPYVVIPSAPAARRLHTAETRSLNNPDLPSPYPPGAQLFFRAVTAIAESTFALKIAFALCDLAIVLVLLDVLRSSKQAIHLVLAYAWNPMLAIEVAGSGHIDILGALLLLVSSAALMRRWRTTAALTLAMAILVKFLPIVLVPLYWKRVRLRDAVLAVAVVVSLYLPFLSHGRIPTGSLGTYVQSFRFNGPIFATLDHFASPRFLTALAVFVGLATAVWVRRVLPESSSAAFAWPMAASLLCAPVVFPWYLLWLLPFLGSPSTRLLAIWTVSIIPTYVMWHLRARGHGWGALPDWVMLLEYGTIVIAAVMFSFRQKLRLATVQQSEN